MTCREKSTLTLRLFGPMEVRAAGQPLPSNLRRKAYWLLALLVLRHDREVARDWLAGTLWPESEERQALHSLRISLTDLRGALGEEAGRLRSPNARCLTLDLSDAVTDISAFDMAVKREDIPSLQAAVSL